MGDDGNRRDFEVWQAGTLDVLPEEDLAKACLYLVRNVLMHKLDAVWLHGTSVRATGHSHLHCAPFPLGVTGYWHSFGSPLVKDVRERMPCRPLLGLQEAPSLSFLTSCSGRWMYCALSPPSGF